MKRRRIQGDQPPVRTKREPERGAGTPGGSIGAPAVPVRLTDPKAIALAEGLIRGIGFELVLVGGLAMGKSFSNSPGRWRWQR